MPNRRREMKIRFYAFDINGSLEFDNWESVLKKIQHYGEQRKLLVFKPWREGGACIVRVLERS